MIGPPPVRDQRRIGALRRAHPDPQPAVAFDQRIGAHSRLRRHAFLAGDLDALSVRGEKQAVVTAAQAIAFEPAHGERQVPVAAAVFQRHRSAIFAPVEHQRLAEQRARERLARHLD
jgi:hypothetical protein